jgi:hypothetical protein
MEILILILNFQLARKEDPLTISVKELPQMIPCFKFPFVGRWERAVIWFIQVRQLAFLAILRLESSPLPPLLVDSPLVPHA